MRLVPSARHALAAVALAALAAGSASAADYFLKLGDIKGESAKSDKPRIAVLEVQAFSWGATQTVYGHGTGGNMGARARTLSGLESETETVEASVGGSGSSGGPGPGGGGSGGLGAGKVSYQDLSVMNRTEPPDRTRASDDSAGKGAGGSERVAKVDAFTIKQSVPTKDVGEARVATGDLDGDGRADIASPRDAASGMPTGKRQHGEVKFSKTLDKSSPLLGRGASRPLLAKGGLKLAAALPGCAVGTRYTEGTLEGGGMRYELKDILITSCAAGQLGLNYAKVIVRGWDPKKKEEVVGQAR